MGLSSLGQVLLFCIHVKSSAFNPISVKITFSLNSNNLLVHYLFCIIIKGYRTIDNRVPTPLLDGEYVPVWTFRQFKLKMQVHRHVI